MPNSKPFEAVSDAQLRVLVESYPRLTGLSLISSNPSQPPIVRGGAGTDSALPLTRGSWRGLDFECNADELREALWNAPRAIVAHGTEADPIFFYGNRLALQLFEMSEEAFARLPSRLSAEPLAQDMRVKLLEKVTQQGYVDGYSGVRIASSGKRFMITDMTVWNLVDAAGGYHGQAAVFSPAT
jgi:hypothetical protein